MHTIDSRKFAIAADYILSKLRFYGCNYIVTGTDKSRIEYGCYFDSASVLGLIPKDMTKAKLMKQLEKELKGV